MRKIKRGDDVMVIAGKDRGRRGRVQRVIPERDRVVVENVNMIKRHTKPNPQQGTTGGIVEKEAPIHVSNVMHYNPKTGKPDRVGVRVEKDGKKVRYYKATQDAVDV